MKTVSLLAVVLLAQATSSPPPAAPAKPSPWERLGRIFSKPGTNAATAGSLTSGAPVTVSPAQLSTDQITRGLKEALGKGLDKAVAQLGHEGGFLTNMNVRIPLPENLRTVEKVLRRVGQEQLADEFVVTMNHAAEKAVPAAAGVFANSLKQMTVDDARGILKGPDNAATEYFRRTAGPELRDKFRPIVATATADAGVTAAYKNLMDKASFASPFLSKESVDLDDYVTARASDGLFKLIAEEEKKIRQDPVARTTDVLRSVFGALGKSVPF